jgi:hypothetical protein
LLITGPPYWQPALAGGAEATSCAAISTAANPPTTQTFMVVSRHIAAAALPSAWAGKYRPRPSQQPMTLPIMSLFFSYLRSRDPKHQDDYERRSEPTISLPWA